ncbi:mucin-5AC-like [Bufo gargarizans]|uniref:mucin-5AC-like n=1 Tax=Bufo gargarizans TaxID=30331 RepID=UPI001CF5F04C|nr:mucin-5AC-like [Bufo gargarizans]
MAINQDYAFYFETLLFLAFLLAAIDTAHNNRVCSTWGNFHFKNFDGDIFYFPGTCNYVYASHCKSAYEDFNIQIRRTVVDNVPVIDRIFMKLDGVPVQIKNNTVSVNGKIVQLPFSGSGIQIAKPDVYLSVTSKLGLVFMWNEDDSLLLELNEKYANQTCGLCGDFNGISIYNEFISNGIQITEAQFGNLQKLDDPTELCNDMPPIAKSNCTDYENICASILLGSAFSKCHSLVAVEQYIEACVQDLCRCDSKNTALCMCNTFAEYSRQCAHAGGEPENWRTNDLCPKTCPYNMQYQECGSPCTDTCSNPERSALCVNYCLEGCFCPPGTVFDDINNFGCIPLDECSCTFNNNSYAAGTSYSTTCSTCVCSGGKWSCNELLCPATCSIDGGSHITTYDQSHYNIHGDCDYVLTKDCKGNSFIVLAELRKCGLTESVTCLKSATLFLNGRETIIVIKPCGNVFVNSVYTQLPVSAANVTIFRPSSFYIVVETTFGVQVVAQLTPFMQIYVALNPSYKGQTCGLCGNFNDKQTDDFQTISGVIEGTAASFANTWKTQADCPNINNVYEDPCSVSVKNEEFAKSRCGLISDPSGPFASCHAAVNPAVYKQNCMFDTCNCEKSEECMCASLTSYVRACATKGVIVSGWRSTVCSEYMNNCPETLSYAYSTSTCQPTCRSLSEPDVTCSIKFTPVDGCTCAKGLYMDDSGKCVPAEACPCYFKGSAVPSGEIVHENGIMCTCTQGKLNCIGNVNQECTAPMVYFDCKNALVGTIGTECQKSCQTLDMACYSAKCVSGCVCPAGLVSDGKGGCIQEEQCPCIHNYATYQPGEKIKMKCNTCTCKDRMWQCTNNPCLGTCAVYGDGHYITFDGKRYSFNGDCEYTLAQDNCGKGGNSSFFRIMTENIPCGTTGTTCSKSIKVFLESYELILTEEHIEVVERGIGGVARYKVRHMGIYLVIEADNGLILMWDRKTSIFIKLSKGFEGQVCGLCGNYDGDGNNDFTTRSMSVVEDVIEFGNSWKISSTCPDAKQLEDACSVNPYRKPWAQKQCSIINSDVFSACHAKVDPSKYYDACVTDSCACNSGGDCECFCTAVAAYAQACGETGACVSWRSPNICPVFCDYYNPEGECEWHYKSCGAPCMKTCRNPSGKCMHELSGLEGCYPSCPADKPFFDEDDMKCVAQCGCYDDEVKLYKVGQLVPSNENCKTCTCSMSGIQCKYEIEACHCEYQGKMYKYNDVIYNTTDGIGGCISAICKENGIYREIRDCDVATTTPFAFTSTSLTTSTGIPLVPLTTICVKEVCQWSEWFDVSYPKLGKNNGDFETYENIKANGSTICDHPKGIECRAQKFPDTQLSDIEQNVQCNVSFGLICLNKNQHPPICYNFKIKVLCCSFERCDILTTSTTTISTAESSTTETSPNTTVITTTPVPTTTTETTSTTTISTTEPTTTETLMPTTETSTSPNTTVITTTLVSTTTTETTSTTTISTTEPTTTETLKPTTETSPNTTVITTTPVPTTRTETTSTTTISTTEPTTTETPTPTTSIQTTCSCHYDHQNFSPGEILYDKVDAAGCSYYAVCNAICIVQRFTGPCITSTTITSSSTTPEKTPNSTTATVTTPITEGCPPYKTNETWLINNCTKATCLGNNEYTIEPVSCPKLEPLNCVNEFPPVKKTSDDGCCEYYECQCVCSGWGDPHYITFDGTYYTFLENCTYVLVQQITPKYDNFRVLIDNYFCDAEDGLSCPQSIMIYYKSNEVVLTRMMFQGKMTNMIRFNHDWVTPGFTKDGITISSTGINMNVGIPEIDAFISFSGLMFKIELPFSKFGYNTEGQCGTCTNNSTEDCRMPSGEIVEDCSEMADHWKVNVTGKPYCNAPDPNVSNTTTQQPKCKPSLLCDIILSRVFAECHKVVPPKPYHEGCTYDSCQIPTDSVECSSLEIYASLCAANGVCIDWRSKTKGHCPYKCSAGKKYDPCGPLHPKSCNTKEVQELDNTYTEGCFCPEGTMLFNSYTDVCVESCSCVGPDGMPKRPGETWTSNCNNCICEKNSLTVQCKPLSCPPLAHTSCSKEGFILKELPDPLQPCCMKNECQCNSSYCLQKEKSCQLGFEVVSVLLEGDCCPSFDCRPLEVCAFNGSLYNPGEKIPQIKDSCMDCVCTNETDPETLLHIVSCKSIQCQIECELGYELISSEGECCGTCKPNACKIQLSDNSIKILKGYEYKIKKAECCGTCIPYACVIQLSDNTTKTLKPEEQYTPPEDKCTTYTCSNSYDVVKNSITCPPFKRSKCLETDK